MKPVKRNIILTPGPATTTDTVKYAQVVPDICPREKEFGDIMGYISNELASFVGDPNEYAAVLFGGSGTAAVEAMISSVVGDGDCVLIINNGAYGKRMCEIAEAYGLSYIEFKSSPIEAINTEELENVIKENKSKLTHLAMIHHETTSGLLNDVPLIGELCRKYNIMLLVDGISSYAAIPIDMKNMNISFLAASSNKHLQGMAGVSFVICNKEALEALKDKKTKNFYLNLYKQHSFFIKENQMRFTPPVQTLYALKQAIIETKEETIKGRYDRYSKSWETLIKGLEEIGMRYLVDKKNHSKIITTVVEPDCDNYSFDDMHDYLKERGYTIYPGKLGNSNTFRIANIGAIDYTDIENFLTEFRKYLQSIGAIVNGKVVYSE